MEVVKIKQRNHVEENQKPLTFERWEPNVCSFQKSSPYIACLTVSKYPTVPYDRPIATMDDIDLTEDPQQEKAKGAYEFWNVRETTVLIRLLVDGIKQGWRDKNGSMSKMTVEKKILPILNATVGCHKTHKHYLSRLKSLRKLYNSMQDLIRFSSGFGWDPISKKFTAPNQVWDDYEKVILYFKA
ncbi:hypothetical protein YC2023_082771 [Brassica napus]